MTDVDGAGVFVVCFYLHGDGLHFLLEIAEELAEQAADKWTSKVESFVGKVISVIRHLSIEHHIQQPFFFSQNVVRKEGGRRRGG